VPPRKPGGPIRLPLVFAAWPGHFDIEIDCIAAV